LTKNGRVGSILTNQEVLTIPKKASQKKKQVCRNKRESIGLKQEKGG